MSVTILVCPCGKRLKAAGLAPGKSGRCPSCGGLIRAPAEAPSAPAAPVVEDEWDWQGTYDLGPADPPPAIRRAEPGRADELPNRRPDDLEVPETPEPDSPPADPVDDDEWDWKGTGYGLGPGGPSPASRPVEAGREVKTPQLAPGADSGGRAPKADGERPAPPRPEAWWPPRLLYPLRSPEGLGMVASVGAAFWVMATLIPEYCLALVADGEKLGTPSMGLFIALVSALPILILIPPALIYWLQYLGRVLVASGEGEGRPPRTPDRNFDGLLTGLSPWLLWLVIGAGVGLLPLEAYGVAVSGGAPWSPWVAVGLGLVGLPYALMALLMTFLHDDPLAARPGAVIGTVARLGPSFLGLSLTTAATLGLGVGAFAAAFALRDRYFPLFILTSLASWLLAAWTSIVAMHTLGSYFALRKDLLQWHRERPRWGVAWKL